MKEPVHDIMRGLVNISICGLIGWGIYHTGSLWALWALVFVIRKDDKAAIEVDFNKSDTEAK